MVNWKLRRIGEVNFEGISCETIYAETECGLLCLYNAFCFHSKTGFNPLKQLRAELELIDIILFFKHAAVLPEYSNRNVIDSFDLIKSYLRTVQILAAKKLMTPLQILIIIEPPSLLLAVIRAAIHHRLSIQG